MANPADTPSQPPEPPEEELTPRERAGAEVAQRVREKALADREQPTEAPEKGATVPEADLVTSTFLGHREGGDDPKRTERAAAIFAGTAATRYSMHVEHHDGSYQIRAVAAAAGLWVPYNALAASQARIAELEKELGR